MATSPPAAAGLSIQDLPPNIFAIVMSTGIVSLAAQGNGWTRLAHGLFALNIAAFVVLWLVVAARLLWHPLRVAADFRSHAKAPGFFTLVAGTCLLGNQCLLLAGQPAAGLALGIVGLLLWCLLTYTILPVLIVAETKPPLEQAISGAWLLAVVGTQAVSVLASLVAPSLAQAHAEPVLLLALGMWLVGSMLYIWLISLIFYRIVFLPLPPSDLTPPYWINMGAMAISTLAGTWLIKRADELALLRELLPFIKGMTLLFWATATWWIPLLLVLGVWRHVRRRVPLAYEHGYWAAVFPLGMYAVCTQRLIGALGLDFLQPLATAFVWIATIAWTATFLGLLSAMWSKARRYPHSAGGELPRNA